jgi:hypothetical protein
MLLYRIGVVEIQSHPNEYPAPNISGQVTVNENMGNGFTMIGTKCTVLVSTINNNSFIKQCFPCRPKMLILDGTLFFHVNFKECTMLSSKFVITDLFNRSIYALLTEKIPAEVDIHLCLSSTSRLG